MKLYLVRQAQSKRNVGIEKSDPDADLTETGIEQAKRLGKYFRDKKIDIVFCSTLKRAKGTLEGIKPYLPSVRVVYTDKIRELDLGIFEMNGEDDWKSWSKAMKESGKPFEEYRPPKGESFNAVFKRANDFMGELYKKYLGKNVLVVSHGIFLLYLILNILDLPISEGKYYALSNAGVSVMSIDKKEK